MAEWNRRAAQDASAFQSEIRENRDVRPPRQRALATLAIRARRHDRKIARQSVGNHADEAADARPEQEGKGGAEFDRHVECHRVSITYAASMLRGAQVHSQIVGGLHAAIEIVDRKPLVVAVDTRKFAL